MTYWHHQWWLGISFDFDTPEVTFYFDDAVNANADHVRVPDWDVGTTEGGSSGSPLFDDKKSNNETLIPIL